MSIYLKRWYYPGTEIAVTFLFDADQARGLRFLTSQLAGHGEDVTTFLNFQLSSIVFIIMITGNSFQSLKFLDFY